MAVWVPSVKLPPSLSVTLFPSTLDTVPLTRSTGLVAGVAVRPETTAAVARAAGVCAEGEATRLAAATGAAACVDATVGACLLPLLFDEPQAAVRTTAPASAVANRTPLI